VSPFDDGLNPLRHAIMTGTPVIALDAGTGAVEAIAVEAARLAGRLDDLRLVHLAPPRAGRRLGPASRRLGPDAVPSPEEIAYTLCTLPTLEPFLPGPGFPPMGTPDQTVTECLGRLGTMPPELADLPPFETGEAFDGRHLVVLIGGNPCKGDRDYLEWLAFEAIGHARAKRLPDPMVFVTHGSDGGLNGFRKLLDWTVIPALRPHEIAVAGPTERVRRRPDLAETFAWRALAAPREAVHRGEGLAWIREGDRAVIARREPGSASSLFWPIELFEVADGWCTGLYFEVTQSASFAPSDEFLSELCRTAWRGGLSGFLSGAASISVSRTSVMLRPGERLLADPPGLSDGPVACAMRDLVDVPLLRAAQCTLRGEIVLRRVGVDPARRAARRDFVLTYPSLSDLLLDEAVLAGVDAGIETLPLVAGRLGIHPAIARRLVGREEMPDACVSLLDTAGQGKYHPGPLLAAFGWDNLPKAGDAGEWAAFKGCLDRVTAPLSQIGAVPPSVIAGLVLGTKARGWAHRLKRMCEVGGDPRDVSDFVRAFARLMFALGVRNPKYTQAFEILARHGSYPALVRASIAWHEQPDLSMSDHGPDPAATWPVPFGPVDLGDGWDAVPLGSMAALRDEGRHGSDATGMEGLAHCAATYGTVCASGRSLVISLRRTTETGTVRETTAELSRSTDGEWWFAGVPFVLAQHRGRRNGPPSEKAVEKLSRLRDLLHGGTVALDPGALKPRTFVPVSRMPIEPEDLLARWDRMLPDFLRGLQVAGFIERIESAASREEAA